MQITFKGKRVVVCGGSRGIGLAIADGFSREGAAVSICARGKDSLAGAASSLGRHGGAVHAAACDLGEASAIAGYIAEAAAELGGIDILVNNASGFGKANDEADWERSVGVDLLATVRASREAQPHLERSGGGVILNTSSISGFGASGRTAPYAAVKAAVINYTQSQALILASKKIRVNGLAPGSIEFPGGTWEQRRTTEPKLYEATLRSIPWGRYGTVEEIANVALFLASDHARWITGQTIIIDGGQSLG